MTLPPWAVDWMLVIAALAVSAYVVFVRRIERWLTLSGERELRRLVPLEVPRARDFTRRELRCFVRLIRNREAASTRSCINTVFAEIANHACATGIGAVSERVVARPNFVLLTGVSAALSGSAVDAEIVRAIAAATVLQNRFRWRLPRWARRLLFSRCGQVEWDDLEPTLGKAALQVAFRGTKEFRIWRRLISVLARDGEWEEVQRLGRRYRAFVRVTRRALRADLNGTVRIGWFRRAPAIEGVMAAEVVASSWMRRTYFDVGRARDWYIPLITRSTNRFLARMSVAKFVCDHLRALPEPEVSKAAQAIEAGISPVGADDYSNFERVFSPECWPLLRPYLTVWSIVRELDLFATARDRRRFWSEITGTRGGL